MYEDECFDRNTNLVSNMALRYGFEDKKSQFIITEGHI